MGATATPIDSPDRGAAPTGRPLVWIVDDSPLECEAVRRALSPEFAVETFTDGSAVLEGLAHAALPDVLVLDWIMPGVSGIEVCRFVRSLYDSLPVLLLTANRETEHLVEGFAAGANDFVPKPFSDLELKARVRALHEARRLRDRVEQGERDRAEAQRHRADAAEERARLSELYLGIIGHDLRNPVSAIAMTARLIGSHSADEHVRLLAQQIEGGSRRMFEMIAALLDVTRTRLGGGIQVHSRTNSLAKLCRQVVDELARVHPSRQIILEASDALAELRFDYHRMGQVVSNLVTNALVHGSAETAVRVVVARAEDEVHLRVINQGPPMRSEVLAHLFDPFRRGQVAPSSPAGLGLGLYISQQIVTAHGGSISVTSTETTTFTVHLPMPA